MFCASQMLISDPRNSESQLPAQMSGSQKDCEVEQEPNYGGPGRVGVGVNGWEEWGGMFLEWNQQCRGGTRTLLQQCR